jgi:phospholipid/cholesterol/gamma-HCH transport system permease protein
MDVLRRLGRRARQMGKTAAEITNLPFAAVKGYRLEAPRGKRLVLRAIVNQVYFTAVEPLPLYFAIATLLGFVVLAASDGLLRPLGLAQWISALSARMVVCELVPIVFALVLTGRSGVAIATELGAMRVNQETDALDVLGINTDYFLVLPRLLGVTMAAVALTAIAPVGLATGWAIGRLLGIVSASLGLVALIDAIDPLLLIEALVKSAALGLALSAINCYHGLQVGRSPTGIPKANVRGSVQAYLACFFIAASGSLLSIMRFSLGAHP